MKTTFLKSIVLAIVTSFSMTTMAEDNHQADKSIHPVEAIAHIPVVGFKVASGVAAVPLMIVGEVGELSSQAGQTLMEVARRPINNSKQNADSNYEKDKGMEF